MTEQIEPVKPPFPYFGGKSKAATAVWERFGNTPNYVEPFAGALAVLLLRPHQQIGTETINDIDCYIANFFRDPMLKIALAGYDSEHDMPSNWSVYRWKTGGGYGSQGTGRGVDNASREIIWFSPHCLKPAQQKGLFDIDEEQ